MEIDVAELCKRLLISLGEDPDREGLAETPERVARMYQELTSGYKQDPLKVAKLFPSESRDDLITVTQIPFYSLCEHHLVPFFGAVHVGYVPNKSIMGLSKFARIVDIYARRLQVQERLTTQIADAIETILSPEGVIVGIRAEHMCMSMRGVCKPGSSTYTETVRGTLQSNTVLLNRFYNALKE